MSRSTLEANPRAVPRKNNEDNTRQGVSAYHDPVPSDLIGWLTRQAKPGSVRVHLVASTDGMLGQMTVSSYDEKDNHLGDEAIEVTTLDYLMTA